MASIRSEQRVRPCQLSNVSHSQYCGGRPRGNPRCYSSFLHVFWARVRTSSSSGQFPTCLRQRYSVLNAQNHAALMMIASRRVSSLRTWHRTRIAGRSLPLSLHIHAFTQTRYRFEIIIRFYCSEAAQHQIDEMHDL